MGDAISWGHHSAFGGTWTDRRDAEAELARRVDAGTVTADLRPALEHWISHGYVLLRGAVPDEAVERCRAELDGVRDELPVRRRGTTEPLLRSQAGDEPAPMLDPHARSLAARDVLLCTPVVDWLTLLFEEAPLLVGAVQDGCATPTGGPHRDPSLVVISEPLQLAGARVALAPTAPLTVFPGSQRLPELPFSGVARHFNPERDGAEALREHDEQLLRAAAEAGIEAVELAMEPGDVVLWAADLLHGDPSGDAAPGAAPTALVAHYCPASRQPTWMDTLPHRARRLAHNGGWLASRYAELADAPAEPTPPAPAPAIERVADALEQHDSDAPTPPPTPASAIPPEPAAHHGRGKGGLMGGVRGLLGRRGRR